MICLWKVKDNDQSAKRKGAYSLENQVKWGSTPYKIENIYVLSGCGDMTRPFFIFYMIARCTMNPSRLTDCIVF